jgi:hypothetical protein
MALPPSNDPHFQMTVECNPAYVQQAAREGML